MIRLHEDRPQSLEKAASSCDSSCMGIQALAVAWFVALLMLGCGRGLDEARPAPAKIQGDQASPPRMFSAWYTESLDGIRQLEKRDAERLERRLAANPEDLTALLQLLAYHDRPDRRNRSEDQRKRVKLTLWLIEHHPESEILRSEMSRFNPGELDDADYRRATVLWEAATRAQPSNGAVQWNAASFFRGFDDERYLGHMEAAAVADPANPFILRPLAYFYARALIEAGPLGARAQAALDVSKNKWVLSNTANFLQGEHNRLLQMEVRNHRIAELAERYFLRAQALDPNLDRRAILPQIDLREIARAERARMEAAQDHQRQAEHASAKLRRLPIDAFPELPPTVAEALRTRNCTVPQSSVEGRQNVIRGEFFAKGETGWAAYCSANQRTALLAFRSGQDANPRSLNESEDAQYAFTLESGSVIYLRQITAVGRDFILMHYRTYGGPEPPPIDHQGIDDSFLEKASVTWYFHEGKWHELQGAD